MTYNKITSEALIAQFYKKVGSMSEGCRKRVGSPELKERTKENARARARVYVRTRVAKTMPTFTKGE